MFSYTVESANELAILLRAGVVFAASCLLAELSLRYYETPILSLKRHLRYES